MGRVVAISLALLVGLLLTGCHKKAPEQKAAAAPAPSTDTPGITGLTVKDPPLSACDLGTVNLTNHTETCVILGPGKDCLVTPNVIDSKTVQLTLALETRKPNGKIHDLAITEVVTKSGKPFEVAVGAYNFSFTPKVVSE